MNDLEIIVNQTRTIHQQDAEIKKYEKSINEALGMLVCISGPLNDNKLQFNRDQLNFLQKLHDKFDILGY